MLIQTAIIKDRSSKTKKIKIKSKRVSGEWDEKR